MARNGRHRRSSAQRPTRPRGQAPLRLVRAGGPLDDAGAGGWNVDPVAVPAGGPSADVDAEFTPWSPERLAAEVDLFFESPMGRCRPADERALLQLALDRLHHAGRYSGYVGISGVNRVLDPTGLAQVELPGPLLHRLPDLLHAYVRHRALHEPPGSAELALHVMGVVDHLEPGWHAAVDEEVTRRADLGPLIDRLLRVHAADVGGPEVLDALDTAPLPEEPLLLDDLDPDLQLLLLDLSHRCDGALRYEPELRTAARRLLVHVAHLDARALRRASPDAVAAGCCYAVVRGNVARGRVVPWLQLGWLAQELGVGRSGIRKRALALLEAIGVSQPPPDDDLPSFLRRRTLRLGDAGLLTGERRRAIARHARHLRDLQARDDMDEAG